MIKICEGCKAILTQEEIDKYGGKCLNCAKKHAEEFPELMRKLGEMDVILIGECRDER